MAELQHEIVYIEWEDSASAARWMRPEEVVEFGKDPFIAVSVGFQVYRDEKAVVLAAQRNAEGWYGNMIRIPLSVIRKELTV